MGVPYEDSVCLTPAGSEGGGRHAGAMATAPARPL